MMLTWVCGESSTARYVFTGEGRIMEEEVLNRLPDSFRDRSLETSCLKGYFHDGHAWNKFTLNLSTSKKKKWVCEICCKNILQKSRSIQCDRCLTWSHFKCSGIKKNAPDLKYFCTTCKDEIAEGILHAFYLEIFKQSPFFRKT